MEHRLPHPSVSESSSYQPHSRARVRNHDDGDHGDGLVSQEHSFQLVDNLRKIYYEEDCFLSDITLCSKDNGEVKAHKIILAAQSEYFKGMFRNEKKDRIEMNITADTLKMVVKTLYTGKTDINIDNVQDLLEASNYLQIRELNEKCIDFMARNLDVSNCVGVLTLADQLSVDRLLHEAINFIGEHFQKLFEASEELKQLPVELFAKCIKSDRIIIYSRYGTVLPAIQREEALVGIIVQYVKHSNYEARVKDTWPLFRALKLPFIAHHLDFKEIGLSDLANFEDDPTLHSLIRSSRIPKEDDLRRRYSVDPFSKHNSHLRAFSVKYNIWTERFGGGPKSAYMEVRPFSCEGGPDKFLRKLKLWFRTFDGKKILGGLKLIWSNGSTDVAGEINENLENNLLDLEEQTAELSDGENFQRLELRCGWFIESLKLTSSTGKVFGPWGGEGGEEKKPHKHIRKGVNPKHVYLDGVRGYVVRAQGAKAVNRVSFKWSFVMDKKVSRYSYHHSVVLRSESERISVLELERDINLTDTEESAPRRDWPPMFFPPPLLEGRVDPYQWSDEDEMWSPPVPPQAQPNAWQMNVQVIPEGVQIEEPALEIMEEGNNDSAEEELENVQV